MPPECFLALAVRVFGRPTDFRCVRGVADRNGHRQVVSPTKGLSLYVDA
jgi:hypothetical protein